jgi:hypothetical protein
MIKVDKKAGNGMPFPDMQQENHSEIPGQTVKNDVDRTNKGCWRSCWSSKKTLNDITRPKMNSGFFACAQSVAGAALSSLLRLGERAEKGRSERLTCAFLAGQDTGSPTARPPDGATCWEHTPKK